MHLELKQSIADGDIDLAAYTRDCVANYGGATPAPSAPAPTDRGPVAAPVSDVDEWLLRDVSATRATGWADRLPSKGTGILRVAEVHATKVAPAGGAPAHFGLVTSYWYECAKSRQRIVTRRYFDENSREIRTIRPSSHVFQPFDAAGPAASLLRSVCGGPQIQGKARASLDMDGAMAWLRAHLRGSADSAPAAASAPAARSAPAGPPPVRAPAPTACVPGARVLVLWRGSWWDATVRGAPDGAGNCPIHYDGYDASWDESVGPERLRPSPSR